MSLGADAIPRVDDLGIDGCRRAVEWQNPIAEVDLEHRINGILEPCPTFTFGQQGDTIIQLCRRYRRYEVCRSHVTGDPVRNPRVWCRSHQFREHSGVENDHASKIGGSRGGSRSIAGSSTPPNAAKRA